ncbi:hypothetical protein CN063_32805, partial [Sinorhizobium meliloti]
MHNDSFRCLWYGDQIASSATLMEISGYIATIVGTAAGLLALYSTVVGCADSDEAAPLFRDDCAPGFRDDLAPCWWGLQAM